MSCQTLPVFQPLQSFCSLPGKINLYGALWTSGSLDEQVALVAVLAHRAMISLTRPQRSCRATRKSPEIVH